MGFLLDTLALQKFHVGEHIAKGKGEGDGGRRKKFHLYEHIAKI